MAIERFEDLDLTRRYTYADYLTWQFEERVELFKGWVARMAGPNTYHQRVSGRLFRKLSDAVDPLGCEVFAAPTDVVIAKSPDGDTVVQPDLLVVCDLSKITKQYIDGAPDLVIEIVSPGNTAKVLKKKYQQYEAAGVREYWVVEPEEKVVLRYVLDANGVFVGLAPETSETEEIRVSIFEGLALSGAQIFP